MKQLLSGHRIHFLQPQVPIADVLQGITTALFLILFFPVWFCFISSLSCISPLFLPLHWSLTFPLVFRLGHGGRNSSCTGRGRGRRWSLPCDTISSGKNIGPWRLGLNTCMPAERRLSRTVSRRQAGSNFCPPCCQWYCVRKKCSHVML
jgi:hypothetical protein